MYKIFLVFLTILVVVKSQTITNSSLRTDDYIKFNRRQYVNNIKDYDLEMETFKENYADRIDTINIQLEMLQDALNKNDERLNPLEVLSDFSKKCVSKYRPLIPTAASVKAAINLCTTAANIQVASLLYSPLATRNTLQNYYNNNFEKDITNCNNTYGNLPLNHTMCVTSVTTTTNLYTINNQKAFATLMEAAECSANANIKKALDCSFMEQNRTVSLIAEANALINRCLQGLDDCSRCTQGYFCSDIHYLRQSQVDYRNATMLNVFNGRNQTLDCLMLKIN